MASRVRTSDITSSSAQFFCCSSHVYGCVCVSVCLCVYRFMFVIAPTVLPQHLHVHCADATVLYLVLCFIDSDLHKYNGSFNLAP